MESFEDKGTCVIANGQIVAWFAEYTQETHQWCTDNYFGQWMTFRKVNPPEIIPLTPDELKECATFRL